MSYKGEIKGYPKEVVEKILLYMNGDEIDHLNKEEKLQYLEANGLVCAFTWEKSPEGFMFWSLINSRNFSGFFKLYPIKKLRIKYSI